MTHNTEGVDFIETEEDVEAVESAVVKIQSTFRGKKIRSKLGQKSPAPAQTSELPTSKTQSSSSAAAASPPTEEAAKTKIPATTNCNKKQEVEEEELNKKVASMQVNEKEKEKTGEPSGSAEAQSKQAQNVSRAGDKNGK